MNIPAKVVSTKFTILSGDKAAVLAELKNIKTSNKVDLKPCETLEEAMEVLGWSVQVKEDGTVISIDLVGENLPPTTNATFMRLGPFVEKGSYVEVKAHDGLGALNWRYCFNGTRFQCVIAD